jgi:ribonuclease Z
MRPSFLPRLVNGPFADPGLFVPFAYENRALLFDLGDLHGFSPRDLLKVSHVFITHTHMDHFQGFDQMLRLFLGREKTVHLFGPEGFIQQVAAHLSGYSWNLVDKFANHFEIVATQVGKTSTVTERFPCRNGFQPSGNLREKPFSGKLLEENAVAVSGIILDHGIPCLGFSLQEPFHVNIRKDALASLGLSTGPWLHSFKQALFQGVNRDNEFVVPVAGGAETDRRFRLGPLADEIARITPGQKITYIADVAFTDANVEKIIPFAAHSDQLFIEAAFLSEHRRIAMEKKHLTARQAGRLAGNAGVRQYVLFHHSPRYEGAQDRFHREARQAYDAAESKTGDQAI